MIKRQLRERRGPQGTDSEGLHKVQRRNAGQSKPQAHQEKHNKLGSAALNEVQEALVTEKRELDTLFVERNQAFAEWQHRYTHTARLFAALLSLAGQDILAERLRPTQRQVQGSELVEPSQVDGEGDDSAEL